MGLELDAVQPDEQAAVIEFLTAAFRLPAGAPFVDPRLMQWKYFQPIADWDGPRSWVMWDGGRIAAHVGIWPLRFASPGGAVSGVHLIDWAAAPDAPGAGVVLYSEMLRRYRLALVLGGAAGARKLLGRMGFSSAGSLHGYARAVRPLRQLRTRPDGFSMPNGAKLLRNLAWNARAGLLRPDPGWSARPIDRFTDALLSKLPTQEPYTCSRRSASMLNYLLQCPTAQCRAFSLHCDRAWMGYFLISRVGGQSRIADIQLVVPGERAFAQACIQGIAAAKADPEACEVVVSCSSDVARAAMQSLGFHLRSEKPIWLYDADAILEKGAPLHVHAVESDSFFLGDLADPYLT